MESILKVISQFDGMKDFLHEHINIGSEKLGGFEARLDKIERYIKTKHVIEECYGSEEDQGGSAFSKDQEEHLEEKEPQE